MFEYNIWFVVFFIFLSLATWRISSIIVNEKGFLQSSIRIRWLFGVRYARIDTLQNIPNVFENLDDEELPRLPSLAKVIQLDLNSKLDEFYVRQVNSSFAELVTCLWCCSVWIGLLLVFAYVLTYEHELSRTIFHALLLAFSASACSIFIEEKLT